MFDSLIISNLPERHCAVLRKPSNTRPTLWVVEDHGARAVVKDYSRNRFLYRHTAGRFLVWREAKALRRLHGVRGVPALYNVLGGLALVMEEIPGKNLEEIQGQGRLTKAFFDDMADLVDRVHRRGIAHCDLKRAPNTLLVGDGTPFIVDWGAAICKSEFPFFPLTRIYRRFLLDDSMAIVKLKLKYCAEAVSPAELARYRHRSRLETFIRQIRDRFRTWLQRLV
ncbi:MAG: hypothetical protein ACOWYE_00505 [Desulfatiglandales bacterium]